MTKKITPDEIIDALGGTSVVAKLCEVSEPAISQWRKYATGIPKARLKYLRAIRPEVFAALQLGDSSAPTTAAAVTQVNPTGETA